MQPEQKPEGDGDGSGALVAGCTGCVGAGAAAVAKSGALAKGCTTAGGAAVKSGAAFKVGAVATGAGGLKGGHATVQAAGRGLLRSHSRTELLDNRALMQDVPELEEALRRGVPIERFMAENPDVTTKVGTYVAKSDREAFTKLAVDDFRGPSIVRPELTQDILKIKASQEKLAQEALADLVRSIQRHPPPLGPGIISREVAAFRHVGAGSDDVAVSVDGLFVEIKVTSGSYTFVAQVDLASLTASSAASAISLAAFQNDFYRVEGSRPTPESPARSRSK
jgi:hypothetical protein